MPTRRELLAQGAGAAALLFFRWDSTKQSEDEIDRLQAFKEIELPA